ncbi:two-component system QseEF-associated lipoprotein QseG [Candidatus Pantoea deserta]|uniref:Two-component system QseEF-associated lipoprotein QseG n=1 Tax=Candidatus Pantoea deserta TaxID=1869313 RepID=A0A3N4PS45_9GAMM|nr:two-component system QseEF-associated lipoprotein QseG [Pantoea deserta]RPE02304.1 two-component system QseEF-associated lipoprotein QseG [Pantoea deserta]
MKIIFASLFTALLSLSLSGCSVSPAVSSAHRDASVAEPEVRLPDYLATDCSIVWRNESATATGNPLYWLRAIDCAERLSPAEARAEAHRWPVEGWARAFKHAILMANGNVTPPERRDYVESLDEYSSRFPNAVRPLIQLWRSNQVAQLDLSDTRSRFAHLQQSSDAQLDALRQQQTQMRKTLNDTQHKLERLTDIERQLSSRKAPDVTESGHGPDAPQHEEP